MLQVVVELCVTHTRAPAHGWTHRQTDPPTKTHTHTHTETHTHTRMYTIIICTLSLSNILTRNLLFMKSIGCRLDPPLPRKPTLSQTGEQTTRHITTDCSRHPERKAHNIADRDLIKHRQYCRQKLEQKTTVHRLECLDSRNCSFSWNKFFFVGDLRSKVWTNALFIRLPSFVSPDLTLWNPLEERKASNFLSIFSFWCLQYLSPVQTYRDSISEQHLYLLKENGCKGRKMG